MSAESLVHRPLSHIYSIRPEVRQTSELNILVPATVYATVSQGRDTVRVGQGQRPHWQGGGTRAHHLRDEGTIRPLTSLSSTSITITLLADLRSSTAL